MQRSQAMFVDIIAEYDVEDDYIRLELEFGSNDVGAFRNLLRVLLIGGLNNTTCTTTVSVDLQRTIVDWVRKSGEWSQAR